MAIPNYKDRVQNAIVDRIVAGPFYPVAYAPSTRKSTTDLNSASIPPASLEVNEVTARFGDTPLKRTRYAQDRTEWLWSALVFWNREVSLERFEAAWLDNPPTLLRDNDHDRQVTIHYRGAAYEHPPQQNPSGGTRVRLTFDAVISPV